ncbi:helix-turn-helix domain-containing protein [uncultured Paenibacillus sp.]|uniref:helix-turn-helix domain-containing protein n=1 Tax=uncultured Paenibacillus sp. TaxID=227322 RepID=UPI0015A9AD92|nr:helix-turn-helix domain-containing protein [uncultured Paenibacillus sp.]DAI82623.1 MAG TPA: helix-turn-helix domain protein [Caudoviricetes sp.]
MKNELFDLVIRAQNGDREAVNEIIKIFTPAIQKACHKTNPNEQDDVGQQIVEIMIKKIMSYDLTQIPDFYEFCRELIEEHRSSKEFSQVTSK